MEWPRDIPTLAPRAADLHKGRAGKVLVVGGAKGMAGAPFLSALGALRMGAGLVCAAVPQSIHATVAGFRPELMTTALPVTASGQLGRQAVQVLMDLTPRWQVAVLGPGGGRHPEVAANLRAITTELPAPLVLDADGLAAWNDHPEGLRQRGARTVLTPHQREAERLAPRTLDAEGASREELASALVEATGATVVLKGPQTLVTDGARQWACPSGGPLLATGGTGDVLSGMIAAALAAALDNDAAHGEPDQAAFEAVCLAVYVHGLAADRLAATFDRGVLASEIADHVPLALREVLA